MAPKPDSKTNKDSSGQKKLIDNGIVEPNLKYMINDVFDKLLWDGVRTKTEDMNNRFLHSDDETILYDHLGYHVLSDVEIGILSSPTFLRLNLIRVCESDLTMYWLHGTTRGQHCLGTSEIAYRLAKKMGYDENTQMKVKLGGLLHDISHPAFSHASEKFIGDTDGCHEDLINDKIMNTEIKGILEKNGFDPLEIVGIAKGEGVLGHIISEWADRIDYLLGDSGFISPLSMKDIYVRVQYITASVINNMKLIDGQLCLPESQMKTLEMFTDLRTELFVKFYWHPLSLATRQVLQMAIQEGLDNNWITKEDLINSFDEMILHKLEKGGSKLEHVASNFSLHYDNLVTLRASDLSADEINMINSGELKRYIVNELGLTEDQVIMGLTIQIDKQVNYNVFDENDNIKQVSFNVRNGMDQRFFYLFVKNNVGHVNVENILKEKLKYNPKNLIDIYDFTLLFEPHNVTHFPSIMKQVIVGENVQLTHHRKTTELDSLFGMNNLSSIAQRLQEWPDAFEQELIGHKMFQRMRYISQFQDLLSGSFLFLSTNRLMHSIEVMLITRKTAKILFNKAIKNKVLDIDEAQAQSIIKHLEMAGLFHDIGHVAFSHVGGNIIETLTGKDHEQIGEQIIRDNFTDILEKHGYDVDLIISYINGESYGKLLTEWTDRFAYLYRDSPTFAPHIHQYHELADFLMSIIPLHNLELTRNGEVAFKENEDLDLLNAFLELRKSMFKYVYLHPFMHATGKVISSLITRAITEGLITEEELIDGDEMSLCKRIPLEWPGAPVLDIINRGLITFYVVDKNFSSKKLSKQTLDKFHSGELRKEILSRVKEELGIDEDCLSLLMDIPLQPRKIDIAILQPDGSVKKLEKTEDIAPEDQVLYIYYLYDAPWQTILNSAKGHKLEEFDLTETDHRQINELGKESIDEIIFEIIPEWEKALVHPLTLDQPDDDF